MRRPPHGCQFPAGAAERDHPDHIPGSVIYVDFIRFRLCSFILLYWMLSLAQGARTTSRLSCGYPGNTPPSLRLSLLSPRRTCKCACALPSVLRGRSFVPISRAGPWFAVLNSCLSHASHTPSSLRRSGG
jgi:hypothetical protein